jgi:Protein of unknown function (DUF4242)
MPRYMVERTFPDGLHIPMTGEGAIACLGAVDHNADFGVTWVHSYVSEDKTKTFCGQPTMDGEAARLSSQRRRQPNSRVMVRAFQVRFWNRRQRWTTLLTRKNSVVGTTTPACWPTGFTSSSIHRICCSSDSHTSMTL